MNTRVSGTLTRRSLLVGAASLAVMVGLPSGVIASEDKIQLGNRTVTIKMTQNGKGPIYVCPHDNENVGVKAAKKVVSAHGGTVVELVHNGERYITFKLAGETYKFDPNRMFTDAGIKATLSSLGPYSAEAHIQVLILADRFRLNFYSGLVWPNLLVAIHNNTNGSFSIKSYEPGGSEASAASAYHINEKLDPDDFYFTTSESWYKKLVAKDRNVALQSSGGPDDGSLSVFAAKERLPYVNVEAENAESHQKKQVEMLEALL